jgi:hypothetical protein
MSTNALILVLFGMAGGLIGMGAYYFRSARRTLDGIQQIVGDDSVQ